MRSTSVPLDVTELATGTLPGHDSTGPAVNVCDHKPAVLNAERSMWMVTFEDGGFSLVVFAPGGGAPCEQ